MAAGGFQSSMSDSLKSNARLLNRNNMFNQLKGINESAEALNLTSLSEEELLEIRNEEKVLLKNSLRKRRIIGFLIIIPLSIVLMTVVYLLVQILM